MPASPPGDGSMVSAPTRSPPCGLPRLMEALLSQESRSPVALRRDAGGYRPSFFRPLSCSIGGVQEFQFGNRAARVVVS